MTSLDHKIPPPVITILCAVLAWALAHFTPDFAYALPARLPIAALFALTGLTLDVFCLLAFRKAKTTPSPLAPSKSTRIVPTGPYAFSRNPMYLGLAMLLIGLCIYLANPLTLLAVVVFVVYITRFQIIPEERLLLIKFGDAYADYIRTVRRWI